MVAGSWRSRFWSTLRVHSLRRWPVVQHIIHAKKLDHFSFKHNFGKYCPILIILSLLHTEINYDQAHSKIHHHTSNLLMHYLVKWTRLLCHPAMKQIWPILQLTATAWGSNDSRAHIVRMMRLCEFIRQTTTWSICASLRSSQFLSPRWLHCRSACCRSGWRLVCCCFTERSARSSLYFAWTQHSFVQS